MAEVNIEDLKPNSHVYKEGRNRINSDEEKMEKPKLKAVVKSSSVVSTKKTIGQRFVDAFIEEDIKDVKKYIIKDVLVPGVKNTILDCLSMIFFQETYGRGRSRDRDDHVPYNSYYNSGRKRKEKDRKRDRDDRYDDDDKIDYRNIVLRNREDAENVVDELHRRIRKYEQASVADLFDLIEISGKYTDNNWGWTDERSIGIKRVSGGFLIDVDEAELLD